MIPNMSEVYNLLLCFPGVKLKVIVPTPCNYVLNLLSISHLSFTSDQAHHCGVICKLDCKLIGGIHKYALVGKRECKRRDNTLPWGLSRVLLQRGVLMPSCLIFKISLVRLTVLNPEIGVAQGLSR